MPQISISGPATAVDEGDKMTFTVHVRPTSTTDLNVYYVVDQTQTQGAVQDLDFKLLRLVVPIPAGQSSADVEAIQVFFDDDGSSLDDGEQVALRLTTVTPAGSAAIDGNADVASGTIDNLTSIPVPDFADNYDTSVEVYSDNATSSAVSFDVDVQNGEGRAYLVEFKARDPVGNTFRVDTVNATAATQPPSYQNLGSGWLVWVEPDSSTHSARDITVDLSRPSSVGNLKSYIVTFFKPDFALTKLIGNTGSSNLTFEYKVRNSSVVPSDTSSDSDDIPKSRIDVYCGLDSWDYLLYSSRLKLKQIPAGEEIPDPADPDDPPEFASVCRGIAFSKGDHVKIQIRLTAVRPPQCGGPPYHCDTPPTSEQVVRYEVANWPFKVNTLWHRQSEITGGLQITADSASPCTSSFSLEIRNANLPPGQQIILPAVSTTDHCRKGSPAWLQGSKPFTTSGGSPAAVEIGPTWIVPVNTTCTINYPNDSTPDDSTDYISQEKSSCRLGDQTYAHASFPGSSATNLESHVFMPDQRNPSTRGVGKREPDAIEYFAEELQFPGGPPVRFEIVGARPPNPTDPNEIVHKVGRTTGWTSGNVNNPIAAAVDPDCPGGWLGEGDNKADDESFDYFECISYATYASAPGDSGAPVFVVDDDPGTADVIEVELVGVHFGSRGDFAMFIPIDRVYAESVARRYIWSTPELVPTAVLGDSALESLVLGSDGRTVTATFEAVDFMLASYYEYEVSLFHHAQGLVAKASGVEDVVVSGQELSPQSGGLVTFDFDLSGLAPKDRVGELTVATKLCLTVDGERLCGEYGPHGPRSVTLPQDAPAGDGSDDEPGTDRADDPPPDPSPGPVDRRSEL